MSDLVRFGVAMDRALLSEFDDRIANRGYENRSEALRDLIRADLTRAAWEKGGKVAATITVVYDTEVRDLLSRLSGIEGEFPGALAGSLRVPLAPGRCMEVMAVRGDEKHLTALSGRIAGTKGVLSCELTLAAPLAPAPKKERP